jgi:hypothetical protein
VKNIAEEPKLSTKNICTKEIDIVNKIKYSNNNSVSLCLCALCVKKIAKKTKA